MFVAGRLATDTIRYTLIGTEVFEILLSIGTFLNFQSIWMSSKLVT